MAIEKMKILGSRFGATSYTALPIQPITSKFCSAGSSKTAPRILIFSIAKGADYSFVVKNGARIFQA